MNSEYYLHLKEVFRVILDYIFSYYKNGNEKFIIPAIICVIYILLFEKEVRNKYIIPLITMVIVILNPILYEKVFSRTYMYWRLFWVFSLHLIFATTFLCLNNRIKNNFLKTVIFACVCVLIVYFGQNNVLKDLDEIISLEKLPKDVVRVADIMLSLEDEPYVIGDDELNLYARQYSSKIHQLWGRNKDGLISSFEGEPKMVYERMLVGDYDFLFNYALNNNYQFVVTHHRFYPEEIANKYGYEIIENIDQFHIYYHTGNVIEHSESEGE